MDMGTVVREIRVAMRGLARAPAFAAMAVVTLALGIGANTAIFSAVDAVLLRPLPFPQADRLIGVRENDRQFPMMSVSYPDYLDWVKDNRTLVNLALYRGNGATLTQPHAPPAVLVGQNASWQYFPVLGVAPELGRTFLPNEDRLGGPNVVVIGDSLWRTRYGADPGILGRVIELDSTAYTVIGVMPRGFPGLAATAGPQTPQYWTAVGPRATQDSGLMDRGSHQGFNGLGRLKPGVTLAAARADLNRIEHALDRAYSKTNAGEGVKVTTYLGFVVRNDGPTALWVLLAAVGVVLLIACANVANLMLARAATRQKASAIRAALGAGRTRLVREQLMESLCLGVGGSALGLALAVLAMRAVPVMLPAGLYLTRIDQVGLDGRVLGFTVALALVTSVGFGIAPALHATRLPIASVLKEGGRDSAAAGGGRLRGVLVGMEMGLAVVLLTGAGLLIRSMIRVESVDPGFNPHGVLTFAVGLPPAKYPQDGQKLEFWRQARERLRRVPGVEAVADALPLPFSGNDWEDSFTVVGRPAPPAGLQPSTNFEAVSDDYFQAMGMHLLRGRAFGEQDTPGSPKVVVIDDTFARRYWPGRDPIGNAIGQQVNIDDSNRIVVGVVRRVMEYGLEGRTEMDALPETFLPVAQAPYAAGAQYVILRTGLSDPLLLRSAAAAAIQAADTDLPIDNVSAMDQRIALSLAMRRLTLWLMGAFAGLALALAAIGIYGVLSYMVAQRAHEIGVRMALGAARGRVLGMVMGQGMLLALAGAVAGELAALPLGRLGESFLFGVSWRDPLTLVVVPSVLALVAALACYLPALRATRVDPCVALRGE